MEALAIAIEFGDAIGAYFSAQDGVRKAILNLALEDALDRTCTEGLVETQLREACDRYVAPLQRDVLLAQRDGNALQFKLDDLEQLLLCEGVEADDRVDTIEEFRAEIAGQFLKQRLIKAASFGFTTV